MIHGRSFGDLYVAQCLSDVLGVIIMSYIHARLAYFLKAYIQTCLCTENLVMGNLMKFTQIIFGLEKANGNPVRLVSTKSIFISICF